MTWRTMKKYMAELEKDNADLDDLEIRSTENLFFSAIFIREERNPQPLKVIQLWRGV